MSSKPIEIKLPTSWDIWRPNANNNNYWDCAGDTYALESGKGHYNGETHDLIDVAVSKVAVDTLKAQLEKTKAALEFYSLTCLYGVKYEGGQSYSPIAVDSGKLARQTLKELGEGSGND